MKRILGQISTMMVLALVITSCQKAPDSTQIGTARANGVTPGTTATASGVVLNGIVTADSSYQTLFQQEVEDFMEGSMDPSQVGLVSSIGANSTGVFVGGKVELASGQPLVIGSSYGNQAITTNSELLIEVFAQASTQVSAQGGAQTVSAPLGPVYLKTSSGYISGNNVYLDFADKYGTVHLEGSFDSSVAVLTFSFDTKLRYDGSGPGYAGTLGSLRVPTCQFFRCK